MSKIKICVDAGHGYDTPGKRTPAMPKDIDYNKDGVMDIKKGISFREHVANVGVAMFLTKELARCGFEIYKSGFDDENPRDDMDISLTKRQLGIKRAGCDYSVSIHFNAYGDGTDFNSAQGIGVYIHNNYPKDSKKFAEVVMKYLIQGTKQKNRGITSAALAMCNCLKMKTKAAILVECAFMTNLNEALNMVSNNDYWEETAVEIAKGICDYCGVTYVEEIQEDPKPEEVYKVLAGAFGYKLNADFLVEKLNEMGFRDAYMYTTFAGGKPLYRVQVGAYKVRSNAEKLLIRTKAAGFYNAYIQNY